MKLPSARHRRLRIVRGKARISRPRYVRRNTRVNRLSTIRRNIRSSRLRRNLRNRSSRNRSLRRNRLRRRRRTVLQRQIRGLPASQPRPLSHSSLLQPPSRTAAAVVYAHGDEAAFRTVAEQIARLPLTERIVILPGPPDGKFQIAKTIPNTVVAYVPELADVCVGLALGVKLAKSDIVLVLDGSHLVTAEFLAEMIAKIDTGHDVVLSDTEDNDSTFSKRSSLSHMREFLNATLGREALRTCSFGQLPYALSRQAISSLGPAVLATPPKAHAVAVLKNLKIEKVRIPRVKPTDPSLQADPQWKKTAGDHLEAWKQAMAEQGSRLHFPDLYRNRAVAGGDRS